MWKDLWNILKERDTLLDEAREESLAMLDHAKSMFDVVVKAMVEEVHQGDLDGISAMDRELNEMQVRIRRKVFTHLATSKGSDLMAGLILTSVVIDLERIGDYTKNIGEAVALIPGKLDFGVNGERYESIVERTREMFRRVRDAYADRDAEKAKAHAEFAHAVNKDCDAFLAEIMRAEAPGDMVHKWLLGLALLLRYLKRTSAHLKNICTAISNPFPQIGYRVQDED